MKLLLCLLVLLTSLFTTAQSRNVTHIPDAEFELNEVIGGPKNKQVSVDEFYLTPLITWKEYKVFLNDVERTKGPQVRNQFTPILPQEVLTEALKTNNFDQDPVTGVSWTNARKFAQWKTVSSNSLTIDFSYRLPTLTEWIAAYHHVSEKNKKSDLNTGCAEWTASAKDESMYEFSHALGIEYRYEALPWDPPSLKRKVVIGNSYYFAPDSLEAHLQLGFYQDSSYAHIGFRLVEVQESDDLEFYDKWIGGHINRYWNAEEEWYYEDTVNFDSGHALFNERQGTLHGTYRSYYTNGEIKAEGTWFLNRRVGKWKVNDSLGNTVIERNYTAPQSFERKLPIPENDYFNSLSISERYFPEYDELGMLKYAYVHERSVIWAKRYWARLYEKNNRTLFNKDRLMYALSTAVKDSVPVYDTLTSNFDVKITQDEFFKRLGNGSVSYFEIKEDYFFDLDRGVADTRIIGICPVIYDSIKKQEIRLAWLYFPSLREHLHQSLVPPNNRGMIRSNFHLRSPSFTSTWDSLDDIFQLRQFDYEIVNSVSTFDRVQSNKMTSKEGFQARMQKVEQEHDLWLQVYSE